MEILLQQDIAALDALNLNVTHLLKSQGQKGWLQLTPFLQSSIPTINFQRIADTYSIPKTYHRVPFYREGDPACLTLFVFKIENHDGAVVLLHTYSKLKPNADIFSKDQVRHDSEKTQGIIQRQTPSHSHCALCHSCVAWTTGNVFVTEKLYIRDGSHINFIQENARPQLSCNYDNTLGKTIHSICVNFCTL